MPSLIAQGHQVTALVRRESKHKPPAGVVEVIWHPVAGELDAARLVGHDAAVHLAGESIASGRWTDAKKRRIIESRVESTRLLAETLARLQTRPRAFVCASATGYYGDRGAEVLTEASAPGSNFLARVCREWEAACEPARAAGIRTVNLRFGVERIVDHLPVRPVREHVRADEPAQGHERNALLGGLKRGMQRRACCVLHAVAACQNCGHKARRRPQLAEAYRRRLDACDAAGANEQVRLQARCGQRDEMQVLDPAANKRARRTGATHGGGLSIQVSATRTGIAPLAARVKQFSEKSYFSS